MDSTAVYCLSIVGLFVLAFFTITKLKPKVAQIEAKVEEITSDALLHTAQVAINDAIKLRDASLASAAAATARAASDTARIQQTISAISALTTPTPSAS